MIREQILVLVLVLVLVSADDTDLILQSDQSGARDISKLDATTRDDATTTKQIEIDRLSCCEY